MVGQTVDDQKFALLMKVMSIICGIGMMILGVMCYVFFEDIETPIDFMMALYYILFGVLGVLAEFPIPHVAKFFSFMKKYFGKGLYFIL